MSKKTHLYVLWTNGNPITAEKMIFMYTINSLIKGWWEKVTLIRFLVISCGFNKIAQRSGDQIDHCDKGVCVSIAAGS